MTDDRAADLVLTGGRVWTADAARRSVEAIAVRDGRIAALGTAREIAAWIAGRTRVVELRGRLVTPGFQDAHIHALHAGIGRRQCDLEGTSGAEEVLARIARYAADRPDATWIVGSGWSLSDFPGGLPRRDALDAVGGGRPAFITNRDGHGAWVSSAALALAGITRDTPDPTGGRIERDPDGSPSGMLQEAAMELVRKLLPEPSDEERVEGALDAQAYLHSLGLTAWQEAISTPADERTYRTLVERGRLTARVEAAMWWTPRQGIDQLDELRERASAVDDGRFRVRSVKLMVDGIVENFTAGMLEPYLAADGTPTTNLGMSFIEPTALAEAVTAIDAAGLQPHFHAIGDRAVREALDAVEAARTANGWTDTRPHISHIQVIHPDDVPRFARLGVVANAQPFWAVHEAQMSELTIPFLGPERARRQYPFRSLRRAGAMLAMGSDWSVSTPDPLLEMEVAVNRVSPDTRDHEPFLPEERLDLVDALAAFTAGSAYVNHLDATGSLEPGRLADLVVLDRDPFVPGTGPIGDARVVATFVDGAPVFEAPGLEG